jgi:hypothetical protein
MGLGRTVEVLYSTLDPSQNVGVKGAAKLDLPEESCVSTANQLQD